LDKRALYVTYDVTDYLVEGKNAIGLWLGYGWFHSGVPGVFQDTPVVMAQVEWSLSNGTQDRIVTDETWTANPSPLKWIGFRGELYDATQEIDGWCKPECDDASWSPAMVVAAPPIVVSAQKVQPNRIALEVHPVAVNELSPGVYEIDMGRAYVGYFQLRIRAARGDRIDLEMNESVLASGRKQSFGQQDIYVAKGDDGEMFRNRFDYRAFRYVTVRGLKQPPVLEDACGFMIHVDSCGTATFECSNDLLNRIQRTVAWTYRCTSMGGNIVDCPHRERLGYGAEGQATMLTAMTHSDAAAMFTHWLEVWRDVQNPSTGMMPHTAPGGGGSQGSPGWGGICVTLPWELYLRYGDQRILEQSYPSIRLWIDFLNSKSKDHILQHYGEETEGFYADWVAPGRQLGGRWINAVPKDCDLFFNNCYFIYNLDLAAKIARVLGKTEDARHYEEQAQLKRQAVHAKYYDPAREVYVNGEQAYQTMALVSGVIPAERRAQLSNMLTLLITEAHKGHLNTGVLGTFFMFQYLLHENRNDLIFQMVNQHTYPSWGWLLDNGTTTIGEQWGGMESQIHSSFLSVNSWFIEGIGGIQVDPVAPGYKHILIRPAVVADLAWAKVRYNSIRGPIVSEWKQADGRFDLHIEIPANTTATVYLPAKNKEAVSEGGKPATEVEGVKFLRLEDTTAVFEVESGRYSFQTEVRS
jgi:alpha-L-rhamnosidase